MGVIQDQQRGQPRNGLTEPAEGIPDQRRVDPAHAQVERGIERVADLENQGGLAHGPRARVCGQRARGWSAIPAAWRASRTARALARALGLSPCRHIVSAARMTRAPEADLTSPEAAIDTAWRAAASGSVMTASGRVRARSVPSSS